MAVAPDAQGNTAALYDMEDASLAGTYEYGPFGDMRIRVPVAHCFGPSPCGAPRGPAQNLLEAGDQRHLLRAQGRLPLAHVAQGFPCLADRLPPLPLLGPVGPSGSDPQLPALGAAAAGGQERQAHRRDHRQHPSCALRVENLRSPSAGQRHGTSHRLRFGRVWNCFTDTSTTAAWRSTTTWWETPSVPPPLARRTGSSLATPNAASAVPCSSPSSKPVAVWTSIPSTISTEPLEAGLPRGGGDAGGGLPPATSGCAHAPQFASHFLLMTFG